MPSSVPVTGGEGFESVRKKSSEEAAPIDDLAALRRAALRWFLLRGRVCGSGDLLVGNSRSARGGVGGGVRSSETDDFSVLWATEFVGLSSQMKEGPRGAARIQEADDLARVTLIPGEDVRSRSKSEVRETINSQSKLDGREHEGSVPS